MGVGEDATKGVDIIKLMTGSSTRTRNAICVGKKDIQRLIAQTKKTDKENEDKRTSSTSSILRVNNLAKYVKKMSKDFTTVNTQLHKLKEE